MGEDDWWFDQPFQQLKYAEERRTRKEKLNLLTALAVMCGGSAIVLILLVLLLRIYQVI